MTRLEQIRGRIEDSIKIHNEHMEPIIPLGAIRSLQQHAFNDIPLLLAVVDQAWRIARISRQDQSAICEPINVAVLPWETIEHLRELLKPLLEEDCSI